MAANWYFPSNNYGTITGIGEAGIETFKGSAYGSLAREICQNSLDARYDINKPVKIEFSCFKIAKEDIPGFKELKKAIDSCLSFWTEQKNKKTTDFFTKAEEILKNDYINVLRISDYNTTGLQGSDKSFNTPWQNLVKASGVSDKDGSAGGSFGIGKSAPFVCSDLRTIFYATKDIDGLTAFQGIAKLVSFRNKSFFGLDMDDTTSGTGYFSADKKNNPIRECKSLDPSYLRDEAGTDIYIVGFNKSSEWKTEIISSVLEEFLLAISNNELIIRINEEEINASNLGDKIEEYKDSANGAYNYYQVLTSENTQIINHNFEGLGTIELYILIQQDLHRKVMMCRKNGMKIFDKKGISSTIQFAGICILKDEEINSYFREMENPQHNKWEPERHTSATKKEAKEKVTELSRFVRNSVLEIGKKTTIDQVDAEGVGDYLPDTEFSETTNEKKEEAISNSISSIEIKCQKIEKDNSGYEQDSDKTDNENEYYDDILSEEISGDYGSKNSYDEEPNIDDNGTGFGTNSGDNPGTNGYEENQADDNTNGINFDENKVSKIGTMSVRVFCTDKSNNTYTLIFIPKKTIEKGYLQISLSGEQGKIKANINSASDLKTNKQLVCKYDRIYLDSILNEQKNKISFSLEYAEECSLEVGLYGYST